MAEIGRLFLLVMAVSLMAALILAVWLIGAATLQMVALILAGAVAASLVIGATAFPIRAWRRRDPTGETHHYHDGTRTVVREVRVLDGRQPTAPEVKLLQLPAQPTGGAFPELLRAAYAAGVGRALNASDPAAGGPSDHELDEVDLAGDADGWGGAIRP